MAIDKYIHWAKRGEVSCEWRRWNPHLRAEQNSIVLSCVRPYAPSFVGEGVGETGVTYLALIAHADIGDGLLVKVKILVVSSALAAIITGKKFLIQLYSDPFLTCSSLAGSPTDLEYFAAAATAFLSTAPSISSFAPSKNPRA